jgi:hypothetical protein
VDKLGDALAQVMEKFNLRSCVALGEGAGADIVCRFAVSNFSNKIKLRQFYSISHHYFNSQMKYHHLVLGVALIHCTSTTHGILEQVREIVSQCWLSYYLLFYLNFFAHFFKFLNLRLDDGIMGKPAWNYLLTHRYGNVSELLMGNLNCAKAFRTHKKISN